MGLSKKEFYETIKKYSVLEPTTNSFYQSSDVQQSPTISNCDKLEKLSFKKVNSLNSI